MLKNFKHMPIFKTLTSVSSPVDGVVLPLEECSDEAIANGLLGRGVLIDPTDNKVYAPVDGRIVLVYETKHAIIIKSDTGIACLIHVGVGSICLNGAPFKVYVKDGEIIHKGQLLMEFDAEMIRNAGYEMRIPFVFPNLNEKDYMSILKVGKVESNSPLIRIKKKQ